MAKQVANGTNTNIGLKETFLDRNAKLIPSDEDTMALTNAKWIAGHHTVETLNDLYNIKPFILNPKYYAGTDEDDATKHTQTIGQIWYVVDEKAFYQLIDWDKRNTKDGWSKTNIKAITGPDGKNNEQHIGPANFITKISIDGDGTLSGTIGHFTNSTTPGSYNGIVNKDVIPNNSQIITNVNIDSTGKLSYTYGVRPILSIDKINNTTHTYVQGQSKFQFDVINGIEVNDHKITYHHSTIETISQSHHNGSFNGDFLTSATLSPTGTLTGSVGKFKNHQTIVQEKDLDSGFILNYDKSQILTYAYIDESGKLWTEATKVLQPIHEISINSNANTVNISYKGFYGIGNDIKTAQLAFNEYTLNFPISSNTNAGVLSADTYTYFENAYTYHNSAYEWIRSNAITKTENNTNPNIIQLYFGGEYSHVKNLSVSHEVDENNIEYTQLNSESETFKLPNLGTKSSEAYPGDQGKNNRDDIEAIYNGDKPLVTPTITTTNYTIYKADGSTQISSSTSNPTAIDYGSWIEWKGTFKWTHDDNYKDPTSTSGSFGTVLPSSDIPSSSFTFAKKQLTDYVTLATQTLSAPKRGLMLTSSNKIVRATGNDTTTKSIGVGIFKKKYWGFVENRSSIKEAVILGLKNVSTTGTDKGMVFDTGVAKTDKVGTGKVYMIYAYPVSSGQLTQASVPGADATGWFNIKVDGGPKTVNITNPANGYKEDYYIYYTVAQNALSGAPLTLS